MTAYLRLFKILLLSVALTGSLAWADPAATVNINQADAVAIAEALSGVGEARARAIVEWREANGDFKSLEDLLEVRGIGDELLARNRERIVLE